MYGASAPQNELARIGETMKTYALYVRIKTFRQPEGKWQYWMDIHAKNQHIAEQQIRDMRCFKHFKLECVSR